MAYGMEVRESGMEILECRVGRHEALGGKDGVMNL